jgi:uncharacterized DUF497 family protein
MQTVVDFQHVDCLQWDAGNARKGANTQDVSQSEVAQVVRNQSPLAMANERHPAIEARFHAFGCTGDRGRRHISFTLRGACRCLPVLCARDMRRRARLGYTREAESGADRRQRGSAAVPGTP